ncbi:hypothetical protein [Luteolibacter soli]|uniref:Uncharacterized protein n=1 Tax=Luteolibacter soli TaxID=3135280 RepID=A0ABU9ASW3_9BACT
MIRFLTLFAVAFSGILLGQSLSILPGEQVVPVTGKLIRLEFETKVDKVYRIESSTNLATWANEGYAFRGIGGKMSALVSNHDLPKLFYRVRDDATADEVAPLLPYGQSTIEGPPGPVGPQGPQGEAGENAELPDTRDIGSPPLLPRTLQRILASRQSGSPRPFRLKYLMLGDSYALDLSAELSAKVAPLREFGLGATATLQAGAASEYSRFDLAPTGLIWRLSGEGQSVQYGLANTSLECYRLKVFYSTTSGGGSFALEASTNGGPWIEIPGASSTEPISTDNGGTVGAGIFTYDFPTTESRRLRAKWVKGTVRVIGFVLSDIRDDPSVPRGGTAFYNLALGGIIVANGRLTPQGVWNTLLRDLQPDFCTYKSDDGEHGAAFAEYYQKIQTAYPMDWVMISRHPSNASVYDTPGSPANSGNELLPTDIQLRDFALAQGQLFINGRTMFPDHATMVKLGLTVDLDPHLTPVGDDYQQQIVMNLLGGSLKPAVQFPGSNAVDVETGARYRTTPLGIVGKSGPLMMFDLLSNSNAGSNFRPFYAISKIDDFGTVGFHQGQANRCFAVLDPNGRMAYNNSTNGWQAGLLAGWSRPAASGVEYFAGDRVTESPLAVSGTSAHTGDLFSVRRNASASSPGTRVAGVKADGAADFGRLKAEIPGYATHAAADADSSLQSGQLYKLNGKRAVYQKP